MPISHVDFTLVAFYNCMTINLNLVPKKKKKVTHTVCLSSKAIKTVYIKHQTFNLYLSMSAS